MARYGTILWAVVIFILVNTELTITSALVIHRNHVLCPILTQIQHQDQEQLQVYFYQLDRLSFDLDHIIPNSGISGIHPQSKYAMTNQVYITIWYQLYEKLFGEKLIARCNHKSQRSLVNCTCPPNSSNIILNAQLDLNSWYSLSSAHITKKSLSGIANFSTILRIDDQSARDIYCGHTALKMDQANKIINLMLTNQLPTSAVKHFYRQLTRLGYWLKNQLHMHLKTFKRITAGQLLSLSLVYTFLSPNGRNQFSNYNFHYGLNQSIDQLLNIPGILTIDTYNRLLIDNVDQLGYIHLIIKALFHHNVDQLLSLSDLCKMISWARIITDQVTAFSKLSHQIPTAGMSKVIISISGPVPLFQFFNPSVRDRSILSHYGNDWTFQDILNQSTIETVITTDQYSQKIAFGQSRNNQILGAQGNMQIISSPACEIFTGLNNTFHFSTFSFGQDLIDGTASGNLIFNQILLKGPFIYTTDSKGVIIPGRFMTVQQDTIFSLHIINNHTSAIHADIKVVNNEQDKLRIHNFDPINFNLKLIKTRTDKTLPITIFHSFKNQSLHVDHKRMIVVITGNSSHNIILRPGVNWHTVIINFNRYRDNLDLSLLPKAVTDTITKLNFLLYHDRMDYIMQFLYHNNFDSSVNYRLNRKKRSNTSPPVNTTQFLFPNGQRITFINSRVTKRSNYSSPTPTPTSITPALSTLAVWSIVIACMTVLVTLIVIFIIILVKYYKIKVVKPSPPIDHLSLDGNRSVDIMETTSNDQRDHQVDHC
ncbi:uncharacterized protein TRIADDRAFT_57102 [Trichoplax adhaerens]|uniref:Uncharacterized protein n=1 Tax=Trichoplax adhaerens TaxID=10228 RepID=B3S0M4_TRIAD|nr:predicted protein [Trichoplax adhaerens]EDV24037.1 predicted protein [Trichoplax adhaerens]|eukprot:XP_002113563.1 predicted protein [Trichoplax adhaerens]